MAKGCRGRRRTASRRLTPYSLPSYNQAFKGFCMKKCSKVLEKKDWEDVTCSVCMEYPHNAVLLLCSSHDKGCRPYMCGTSYRHSNCLYQYKKAYTKVTKVHHSQPLHSSVNFNVAPLSSSTVGKGEVAELSCPLCRGQVKGWTVVEVVRDFLNAKRRSCMQQNCSFVGNYKELRKHVRASHPAARPHEVDPAMEQSWRQLENEREQDDVLSMIRSSMPGATVFGDYVIDGNHYEFDSDEGTFDANLMDRDEVFDVGLESNLVNMFLLIHAFGSAGSAGQHRQRSRVAQSSAEESAVGIHHNTPVDDSDSFDQGDDHDRSEEIENGITALFGQSGRRRRRR